MPLTLSAGDVAVVQVSLDPDADLLAEAFELLDADERARAGRFAREADRRRFVLSHAAVRRLLAPLVGARPDALRFDAGAHGKPRLRMATRDVRFSLSHSGDRALVAVTTGREVGVDVEGWRAVDLLPLAHRFFASAECARIERLPPPARQAAFFRVWTRKESLVKATGRGLSFPLQTFDAGDEDAADPVALEAAGEDSIVRRWTIRSLAAPPGWSAAVAVEGGCERVVIAG